MASQAEVIAFLETEYPGSDFQVEAVDRRSCRVRYGVVEEDLRKPPAGEDIFADCRLIKVGRVLVFGNVMIYSDGHEEPVAHATGTYSVPTDR